jgi:hypothetical protein
VDKQSVLADLLSDWYDPIPLTEDAPLREHLYPYRATTTSTDDLFYHYDKILAAQPGLC